LPEEWAVDRERAEAIWRALQDLSPPLRATVVLRYYEELPYREIAKLAWTFAGQRFGLLRSRKEDKEVRRM